jgi:hypothetical protein
MARNYFIISELFKEQWQGQKNGVNIFFALQDNLGRWLVDTNTANGFPEAFEGQNFDVVQDLEPSAFPIQTPNS